MNTGDGELTGVMVFEDDLKLSDADLLAAIQDRVNCLETFVLDSAADVRRKAAECT